MKKVRINTSAKSYPVFIGNDLFKSLPKLVREFNLPERAFIILDEKVNLIYGSLIRKVMRSFKGKVHYCVLTSSERTKALNTVQQIFASLSEEKFARDTLVIAIGGGIIGDTAGFAASSYMRGVPIVHVPTTLLSAVDSSVGGKTAVNFKGIKNLIGSFYNPSFVVADTNFLKSLPQKEFISGFGEVIKYSYFTDGKFYSGLLSDYDLFMKRDLEFVNKAIYECIKIKSAVVSKDEKEILGIRKILNFGHTFSHAFESHFAYRLSHGKAVMAGIISALFLSFKKGLIDKSQLEYMLKLPLKFKSSIGLKSFDEKEILRLMSYDKKSSEELIQFVLIKNFGEILIDMNASRNEIYQALKNTRKVLV